MNKTISPKTYYGVCVALLALLALTAGASVLPLGPFNVVAAVGIAVCKALLILVFFMHLKISGRVVRLFAGMGFVWLGILFFLALNDFLTRGYLGIPGK
jgi:cytochrome c oxidase subunit 4